VQWIKCWQWFLTEDCRYILFALPNTWNRPFLSSKDKNEFIYLFEIYAINSTSRPYLARTRNQISSLPPTHQKLSQMKGERRLLPSQCWNSRILLFEAGWYFEKQSPLEISSCYHYW
jgi:hypothetical protein